MFTSTKNYISTITRSRPKSQTVLLLVSTVLYGLSLTQPAFYTDGEKFDEYSNSLILVMFGWMGLFFFGAGFIFWVANPFLWLAWRFFIQGDKLAFFAGVVASASAIYFGCTDIASKLCAGYWLWLSSILVMTSGAGYFWFKRQLR